MRIRSTSYELKEINGNYEKVASTLRLEAMLHIPIGNREQFYMPGGQVTLQLRRSGDKTFLDVDRISWREPKYVKNLVKILGGELSNRYERVFAPDKSVKYQVEPHRPGVLG